MKTILKNLIYTIIFLVCIWGAFHIGKWVNRKTPSAETIFITDTLEIDKPRDVIKWYEKIKWKEAKPETIRVVKYMTWMDSIYCAISLEKSEDKVKVILKKDKDVFRYTYKCNANKWKWYGTRDGGKLIQQRFSNPFSFRGVVCGAIYSFSPNGEITPYIETGIEVWKLEFIAGADRNKLYGKVGVRLW